MFPELMPKAVANFVELCKGTTNCKRFYNQFLAVTAFTTTTNPVPGDPPIITPKKLQLVGTKFHRIVKTFGIFGGDLFNGDGSSGESIYGMAFEDEYLKLTHDSPYLVTMVKPGSTPDTNNSQFMITLSQLKFLDARYEVFGRLRNTSFALVDRIAEQAGTDGWSDYETPLKEVKITDCLLTDPTPPAPPAAPATPAP